MVLGWTDDGGKIWDYLQVNDGLNETGRASVLPRKNGELYYTGYIGGTDYGRDVKSDIWEFVIDKK